MGEEDVHVIPLDDLMEHNTEDAECRCDPTIKMVGGVLVVIHNSYDGREEREAVHG